MNEHLDMGKSNDDCIEQMMFAEAATTSGTEVDTETSSSSEVEAEEQAVNLCDILKDFMEKHPECAEEADDVVEEARTEQSKDEVLERARAALSHAAFDGRLEGALAAARADRLREQEAVAKPQMSLSAFREKLSTTLAAAVNDGRLQSAVAAVKKSRDCQPAEEVRDVDTLRLMMRRKLEQAAPQVRDVDTLRLMMRRKIEQAASDGSLFTAVEKVKEEQERCVSDLKHDVRQTIVEAMQSGRLEAIVKEATERNAQREAEDLRLQIRDTLSTACFDGRLRQAFEQAVKPKKEPTVEDLRLQAQKSITESLSSGRLREVLASIKTPQQASKPQGFEALRLSLRDTFSRAAADGRLEAALSASSEEKCNVEALHLTARNNLMAAHMNGTLADTLNAVSKTSDFDVEALRLKTRNHLAEAMSTGRLETVLKQVKSQEQAKQPSMMDVRMHLQSTLAAATGDGRLEAALSKLRATKPAGEESPEDTRQQVRTALFEGLNSGKLREAFSQITKAREEKSIQALRSQARNALEKAAATGKIQKEVIDETESLRLKARALLSQAASNAPVQRTAKPTTAQASLDVDAITAKLRATLLGATRDGSFEKALQDAKKASAEDDLKAKLQQIFHGASSSGQFAEALQESRSTEVAAAAPSRALPVKPASAKGSTRPCRHFQAQKPAIVTLDEPDLISNDYAPPMTPSTEARRNRRIHGGIAREAASDQHVPMEVMPPTPGRRSVVVNFRMDVYAASATQGDATAPCGYDDEENDRSQWSIPAPHGVSSLRVQPGSKMRSSSHSGASRSSRPPSAHQPSAMSLDLGDQIIVPSEPIVKPAEPPRSARTSQSLGAVRVRVPNEASRVLPNLSNEIFSKGPKFLPNLSNNMGGWEISSSKINNVAAMRSMDIGLSSQQWDVSRIIA